MGRLSETSQRYRPTSILIPDSHSHLFMSSKLLTGQQPISNPESSMPRSANANQKQLWDYVNPLKNYLRSISADVDPELRETLPLLPNMVHPSLSVLPPLSRACSTRTLLDLPIHYTTPSHPMIHIALELPGFCSQTPTLLLLHLSLEYWACPTLDQLQQRPTSTKLSRIRTRRRNPNPVHHLTMNVPTLVYPANVVFYPILPRPPISTPKADGPKQSHSDSASSSGIVISSPKEKECTLLPISTLEAGSMSMFRLYGRRIKEFNWGSTCIGNTLVNLSRNRRRLIQWLDYLPVLNLLE